MQLARGGIRSGDPPDLAAPTRGIRPSLSWIRWTRTRAWRVGARSRLTRNAALAAGGGKVVQRLRTGSWACWVWRFSYLSSSRGLQRITNEVHPERLPDNVMRRSARRSRGRSASPNAIGHVSRGAKPAYRPISGRDYARPRGVDRGHRGLVNEPRYGSACEDGWREADG
jgi:hypothetical protein